MNSTLIISIIITAIIVILVLLSMKSNDIDTKIKSVGEVFGCIIWIGFLLGIVCSIVGCFIDEPQSQQEVIDYTKVVLVSSGKTIQVPNKEFKNRDTIYIRSNHTYINDTGRDLVKYAVKYTKNGYYSDNEEPTGWIIKPNEYFFWKPEDSDYRMFCTPPETITITVRRSSPHRDCHYLHFIDYADNVKGSVGLINK